MTYKDFLPDRRLGRRAGQLAQALTTLRTASVAKLASTWAEQIAFYRFLSNERVRLSDLIDALGAACVRACSHATTTTNAGEALESERSSERSSGPKHLLLIQDTTELNFQSHAGRIQPGSGLGVISDGESLGFLLHPTLVVEAATGWALGFADVRCWARPPAAPNRDPRQYQRLPIEAKESYRWIEATQAASKRLRELDRCDASEPVGTKPVGTKPVDGLESLGEQAGEHTPLTIVADREADIYDLMARLPSGLHTGTHTGTQTGTQTGTHMVIHMVIRAHHNRRIEEAPGKLDAFLKEQPVAGRRTVWLRGDVRRKTSGREALLEYRFGRVHVLRPNTCLDPNAPEQLPVYALQIREAPPAVSDGKAPGKASGKASGKAPICWNLLTTHPIESMEEAVQVGEWYRQRWHIEQVFRLLKTKGLDVEASELETGTALMRLGVMALGAALDVMRLMMAEREAPEREAPERSVAAQPLGHVFTASQQACLQRLSNQLEGTTRKQQNPHRGGTLSWAAWVIARLGGWKGYRSQRRAGPITYHEGLRRFALIYEGWHLSNHDLYKP